MRRAGPAPVKPRAGLRGALSDSTASPTFKLQTVNLRRQRIKPVDTAFPGGYFERN